MSVAKVHDEHEVASQKRLSVIDASLTAIMIGAGETYLSAFAIALGATALHMGMLASLPQLGGAMGFLLGLRLSKRVEQRPRFLALGALFQATCWLALAVLAALGAVAPELPEAAGQAPTAVQFQILACASLYYLIGSVLSPAWNALIGQSIPGEQRPKFFARRNGWVALFTSISFVSAGLLLELTSQHQQVMLGFVGIFLCAAVARLLSGLALSRHHEPGVQPSASADFTFWQFLSRLPQANFARFTLFCSGMHFAIGLGSPFMALYLLRDIGYSYLEYTALVAAALLAQFVTLRWWGVISEKYGNRYLLWWSGYGMVVTPLFFLVSTNFWWMLFTHIANGAAWAAFCLAMLNFLFDAVTPERRARCSAYLNFLNSTGLLTGGLVGAALTRIAFVELPAPGVGMFSEIGVLLSLSFAARLVCAVFGPRFFHEVREHQHPDTRRFIVRIRHARPFSSPNFSLYTWQRRTGKAPKSDDA